MYTSTRIGQEVFLLVSLMVDDNETLSIADLYPDLTPEEQAEAKYNLQRYVEVVGRILDKFEEDDKLDVLDILLKRKKRKSE